MKSKADLRVIELINKSPKTIEEMRELDEVMNVLSEELDFEAFSLVEELKAVGVKCNKLWDITRIGINDIALEVLINHLSKNYHNKNMEPILRAIRNKKAKGKGIVELFALYHKLPKDDYLREDVSRTICSVITKKDLDVILEIVKDKSNSRSRCSFIEAMGAFKYKKSENILVDILEEEDIAVLRCTIVSLAKLKSLHSIDKIRLLVNHENKFIKKTAEKALLKLDSTFVIDLPKKVKKQAQVKKEYSKVDWFRNKEWSVEIETAFFERLKRSRDKGQHLKIQAYYLSEILPEVSLRLINDNFKLLSNIDLSSAYRNMAQAYITIKNFEKAISSFESALAQEEIYPNSLTDSWISFPYFIVSQELINYYNRAKEVLVKYKKRNNETPIENFKYNACHSLIALENGNKEEAKIFAKIALEESNRTYSGFFKHPKLCLVSKSKHASVTDRLEMILNN